MVAKFSLTLPDYGFGNSQIVELLPTDKVAVEVAPKNDGGV